MEMKFKGVYIIIKKIISQFNVKVLLIQISNKNFSVRKNSLLIVQVRNIEQVNVRVSRPVEFVTENTIHSFVIRIGFIIDHNQKQSISNIPCRFNQSRWNYL